jgi:hypothetical protein
MVKSKLITAHYDEESGLSYVKIANKFGTFDALAALHPKDKERGSRYAGCEYAHIRAEIKSVKEQIKSQRYRIKVLTELLAEYQNSNNVNINSIESKKVKRKITEEIKKLTDLKQDKIKLEQSLENKIQSRERILNSFNQKKQAKNK